jgi:hypothetical protein
MLKKEDIIRQLQIASKAIRDSRDECNEQFYNYFQKIISKSKYFFIGYNKNCPSPELINKKISFIFNNGFELVDKFDYIEIGINKCLGANVSYTLFKNINIK